jgi:integrase
MQDSSSQKAARRKLPKRRMTGVTPRHERKCPAKGWDAEGVCKCNPSAQAAVWDNRAGKYVRKTFTGQGCFQAAANWKRDTERGFQTGELTSTASPLFRNAREQFVKGIEGETTEIFGGPILTRKGTPFKPSTRRSYAKALEQRLGPEFDPFKLEDLRRNEWQNFADELLAEGLDPQTIRNLLMPGRVIYKRVIRRGKGVTVNPLTDLELPALEEKPRSIPTAKEAATYIEELLEERDRALWATAFYAGPRQGCLRDLRLENVHLDDGYLDVVSSWDPVEGSGPPKSKAGKRRVFICEHLDAHLRHYIEGLGRTTGFVFSKSATKPYDYDRAVGRAERAWKAAGLEPVTFQTARHAFRSFLDAVPAISETRADRYQGHASSNALRARYTHSLDGQLALDAAAFDEYLTAAEGDVVIPLRKAS